MFHYIRQRVHLSTNQGHSFFFLGSPFVDFHTCFPNSILAIPALRTCLQILICPLVHYLLKLPSVFGKFCRFFVVVTIIVNFPLFL